jgi:cobalt-zinc-cadmium efflux system outer membrane protein
MKGEAFMLRAVPMVVAALTLLALLGDLPAAAETLDHAYARELVLNQHSGLKVLEEERLAAEEAVRQASAYPNPEVEVAAENLGTDEIEAVLTQPVLLGGKRGAAIQVARQRMELTELRLKGAYMGIEAELLRRFISVVAAQRRLELVDSLIGVSVHGVGAVQRLVDAGAGKEIDLLRAELERDELQLERARLQRDLGAAEIGLCELWGETGFKFDGVRGSLLGHLTLPTRQELEATMEEHPEILQLATDTFLAEAKIAEAEAEGKPELALSAGYLRNQEAGEDILITGVSFTLPLLDRNEAAVGEKLHELAAVRHEVKQQRVERAAKLATLYDEIKGTGRELSTVSGEVLTRAVIIHDTILDYYSHGKTGILDVLEARRHLLELRMRIVDLAEEQAVLAAELQELTGHQVDIIE